MRYALAVLVIIFIGPAEAQSSKEALQLCQSDPMYGDSFRMSVEYTLRKERGTEPDDAEVEEVMDAAQDHGIKECLAHLSEDPSIFHALSSMSGFAAESGWTAWRGQCEKVAAPKGPCIEAEGRAAEEVRNLNTDAISQKVSRICRNLISDRKPAGAKEAEYRIWLTCIKSGLQVHPTAHALE